MIRAGAAREDDVGEPRGAAGHGMSGGALGSKAARGWGDAL
jgi:hypothetical protein